MIEELIQLGTSSVLSQRLRSLLSMLGIAIGVAAVILLTSIGEGARVYIVSQFTQFGTNVLAINPGKTETIGIPGVLGGTTNKLTLDDADALKRIPGVEIVVPLSVGQSRVEADGRGRSVFVYGVSPQMLDVWKFKVGQGSFLPETDWRRRTPVAVLGPTLKRELFGDENALGRFVRIAGFRLRVIGVMAPKGRILGQDIDDSAYVPVATALKMFNQDELTEIDVTFAHESMTDSVEAAVKVMLSERHDGREDFTITTQTAMLDVFGKIMDVITMSVGAIGGISLLVGAIGIMTMMWIAVGERTSEIGLLRAVGATSTQVLGLFLVESVVLAGLGGAAGVGLGMGIAWLLTTLVPALPMHTPPEFVVAAIGVSVLTGLLSGVLPARRAAGLDPIEALHVD